MYGSDIGTLLIDYYILFENNMITDEQKQLFKVALQRMLKVAENENNFCILVSLFKKTSDDEMKISLLSMIPVFEEQYLLTKDIIDELIYRISFESAEVVVEIVLAIMRIDRLKFHQNSINIIDVTPEKGELYDLLIPHVQVHPDLFPLMCGLSLHIKPEKFNLLMYDIKPCDNKTELWYLFPMILLMHDELSSNSGNYISMIFWIASNFNVNTTKNEIADIMFLILLLSNNEKFVIFDEFMNIICQIYNRSRFNNKSIINLIFSICLKLVRPRKQK